MSLDKGVDGSLPPAPFSFHERGSEELRVCVSVSLCVSECECVCLCAVCVSECESVCDGVCVSV